MVCVATVMSEWSPEQEKEVPDLSQSEKGSRGIQFRIEKKKNHMEDLPKMKAKCISPFLSGSADWTCLW